MDECTHCGFEYKWPHSCQTSMRERINFLNDVVDKAFNQFENITVADDLKTAHDRAHAFIGWAYNNVPGYAPSGGAEHE